MKFGDFVVTYMINVFQIYFKDVEGDGKLCGDTCNMIMDLHVYYREVG